MTDSAAEFDRFLDQLVAGHATGPFADGGLERTARLFQHAAPRHTPDRLFAARLRASLLSAPVERRVGVARSALPGRFAVLRLPAGNRVRAYAELAALLLVLLPALWLITRPESASDPGPTGDNATTFGAVGTSTAEVELGLPTTTPIPVVTVVPEPLITLTPGPGSDTATVLPTVVPGDAGAVSAGFRPGAIVITLFGIDLARGPSSSAGANVSLPPGRVLVVTGAPTADDTFDWIPVADPTTNADGWVPSVAIAAAELGGDEITAGTIVVTSVERVNVRVDHAVNAPVDFVLEEDRALLVTGDTIESDGYVWLPVRDPVSGREGWIASEFVTAVRDPAVEGGASPTPTLESAVVPTTTPTVVATAGVPLPTIGAAEGDEPIGAVSDVHTETETYLRSEPRPDSEVVATLPAVTRLVVTGAPIADNVGSLWLPVRVPATGAMGWVPASRVRTSAIDGQAVADGDAVVATDAVNLRADPSFQAEVVAVIEPGQQVVIVGSVVERDHTKWVKVLDLNTRDSGWIVTEFLNVPESAATAVPTVAP